MAQSELYEFFIRNKNKFFTSNDLSKIFNIRQNSISRNIHRMIKGNLKIEVVKKSNAVHDLIYGINEKNLNKIDIINEYNKSKSLNTMELN